jgi:SET domain-containing protein
MKPGDILIPWIDPRMKSLPSALGGRGLFALAPIHIGEALIKWGGVVFTRAEILAGKANPETIAVLDRDLYLADPVDALLTDEYALNHSCDPNAWMLDAITVIARRPIAVGEEITADYALWLFEQDWKLDPCHCGSSLCRGQVTSQDWRRPELRARYHEHFTPYLNRLIKNG